MNQLIQKTNQAYCAIRARIVHALVSNKGEGYIDTMIKMAIAVVVGSILLVAIIAIIGQDQDSGILKVIKEKIEGFFTKGSY